MFEIKEGSNYFTMLLRILKVYGYKYKAFMLIKTFQLPKTNLINFQIIRFTFFLFDILNINMQTMG